MTPERLDELDKLATDCCWAFCPDQAKELIVEVRKSWAELTVLKTPHQCCDCENLKETDEFVRYCSVAPIDIGNIETPWLCGHFKVKGTK